MSDEGIDVVGFLSQDELTDLLRSTKALVAPSLGGESFGMVLTRAFACATPVVASDIEGYREVVTPETAVPVAPGDPAALVEAVEALLADEPRRVAMGERRGSSRASGTAGRTSPHGSRGSTSASSSRPGREGGRVTRLEALARNPWARGLFVLASLVRAILVLWWRGPEWDTVYHAFDFVSWRWVVVGVILNLLSVLARALSWNVTIHQALPPPLPTFPQVFSAFGVGLLGQRRPPGPGGRARPRRCAPPAPAGTPRHERDPARDGVLPPALRPVPDRAARRLRPRDGEDAALGRDRAS